MIVDDHALFRSGVRAEVESHLDVLAEAGSVEEAVRLILEHRPTWSSSTSTCRAGAGRR